jgi:hypothetical protein
MSKNNRKIPKTSELTTFGPPPQAVLNNRLIDNPHGTHRAVIYGAGSRGLANFIRPMSLVAYKLGVTSCGNAQRRVADLRRKQYGSMFGRPAASPKTLHVIEQAEEWFLVPWLPEHLGKNADLPPGFHLREGVLEVEIRCDVSIETVDMAVHSMMAPRALDAFFSTDEGRKRLISAGYDPEGSMLTRYTLMYERVRISRVTEIYLYRPQVELRRLVDCLATVLGPLMPGGTNSAEAA